MSERSISSQTLPSRERRSFLTRINAGFASLAALTVGGVAMAQTKSATGRWEPARHEKDDWMDQLPGKHRLVFDTTAWDALADGLLFANNFIRVNKSDYGLNSNELAVIVVVRHRSTPFGYNDAMWEKYSKSIATRSRVEDPKTKEAPKINLYNSKNYGDELGNRGNTLESLFQQGVQLAVCGSSTKAYAQGIAQATGGNADTIFAELASNLISKTNARIVPAGIVAVQRAQERGYSLVSTWA